MGSEPARALHQALRLRRQARAARIPDVDRLKEELASLRFWQGIGVVTLITLAGWLVTNAGDAPIWTFVIAAAGVVLLTIGTIVFMLRIKERIEKLARV